MLLLLEILGNMCIVIICLLVHDVINLEINLSYQAVFFLHDQKNQDKNLNTLRKKKASKTE